MGREVEWKGQFAIVVRVKQTVCERAEVVKRVVCGKGNVLFGNVFLVGRERGGTDSL